RLDESTAPTDIMPGYAAGNATGAGEVEVDSLPDAATARMPASSARVNALRSNVVPLSEPSERLMTQSPPSAAFFVSTQSSAVTTFSVEPDPVLSSTFTLHSLMSGATPTTPCVLFAAATMPAQCVPWPLSSNGSLLSLKVFSPP